MKFFDSHCHLQFDAFDLMLEKIITELRESGSKVINVGSSIENSFSSVQLAKKYADIFCSAVGVHPFHSLGFEISKDKNEAKKYDVFYPQDLLKLEALAKEKEVKAIGECGIDFSYLNNLKGSDKEVLSWKDSQKKHFVFQIKLALKLNLPLILHIRKDYKLALEILKEMKYDGKAVFHFFKGKREDFYEISKCKNYWFGFSNIITYDESMDKIIKEIDLNRVMVETDAPYVSPKHIKGEINEPKNVFYVAEKIGSLKGIKSEEILKITHDNTRDFFQW